MHGHGHHQLDRPWQWPVADWPAVVVVVVLSAGRPAD
jgi:hypothetical protein